MSRLTFGRYSEALDGQLEMQRFYAMRREQVDSRSRSSLSVPIRSGTTIEEAEESYRQLIDKVLPVLDHATPVYVERWIMEMLEDAAAEFPTDVALRPNHLPAPAGFCYFGGNFKIPLLETITGFTAFVSGFMWREVRYTDRETGVTKDGVWLVPFGQSYRAHEGPVHPSDTQNSIFSPMVWLYRKSIDDDEHFSGRQTNQDANEPAVAAYYDRKGGLQQVETTAGAMDAVDYDRALQTRRIAFSIWSFMQQSVAVVSTKRADRATRKRVEREAPKHEPIVQVIELRARHYAQHEAYLEAVERDYDSRWIVRGHWHRFWVGAHDSPDRHLEPRWLEPYVKGPDGAPIKDAAKLFAVMR